MYGKQRFTLCEVSQKDVAKLLFEIAKASIGISTYISKNTQFFFDILFNI